MNRNYVYVFRTPNNTCNVINYSGKSDVNSFLYLFDIWGSRGCQKICSDGTHCAFWFECSNSFYELLHTKEMENAFNRLGVILTFDNSVIMQID